MKPQSKVLALLGLAVLGTIGQAKADPICNTIQECRQMRSQIESRIRELQNGDEQMTRTTITGAVFTKITDREHFEGAWQDQSGMIWGNTVKNANGSDRGMNQIQATEYCQSIGAQLPSREDFARLREYMGAQSGTYRRGYLPQILPGLADNWYWSSSFFPSDSNYAFIFVGYDGDIHDGNRLNFSAVRCVTR
jgi:hypothetical protein